MNSEFETLLPTGVVTTTETVPAACAGVVQVIVVLFTTVTFIAAEPPKVTLLAPINEVPVKVTFVPPVAGPVAGATLVSVGATRYVKAAG